jgi:hypothetical protein
MRDMIHGKVQVPEMAFLIIVYVSASFFLQISLVQQLWILTDSNLSRRFIASEDRGSMVLWNVVNFYTVPAPERRFNVSYGSC